MVPLGSTGLTLSEFFSVSTLMRYDLSTSRINKDTICRILHILFTEHFYIAI